MSKRTLWYSPQSNHTFLRMMTLMATFTFFVIEKTAILASPTFILRGCAITVFNTNTNILHHDKRVIGFYELSCMLNARKFNKGKSA
ncbi:hypothetical protein RhiirA1_414435 [Rhizophagus irregularis]|uniref:Uncharacterized protein n=1 Tax=Rhizophagus irregularis TaxID=588596 RepID=A0A2N0S4C4_9GLOM|nr:hypothetical protein RhiirA1_414435 [Rhizophagus irregularis]